MSLAKRNVPKLRCAKNVHFHVESVEAFGFYFVVCIGSNCGFYTLVLAAKIHIVQFYES